MKKHQKSVNLIAKNIFKSDDETVVKRDFNQLYENFINFSENINK